VGHATIEGDGVVLRPTSNADFLFLRRFFNDPGVFERWDGSPQTDEEIRQKYVGLRSPQVECFIIDHEGRSVGFVQHHSSDDGSAGGGMDMVLMPEARGHGIGTAVVLAMTAFVGSRLGWSRLTVDPDVSNERGVNFWTRVGFVPMRVVDDDEQRPGPYVVMEWSRSLG
jgi:aminoglycoside 6'-N-acetyltransferase